MSNHPLWKDLKRLVELDQQTGNVSKRIAEIEQKIEEDRAILPELEQTIAELKQATINAKKHINHIELNSKSLKEQDEQKRQALDKVTKAKEYEALEHEIASIQQELSKNDDALITAWSNLELAQKNENSGVPEVEGKIALLNADIAEKEASIETIKQNAKKLEEEREQHASSIPSDWLTRYERMKTKVADPIVPVINSSCSSCYYSIPPQDFSRLKRNAILPCRSCYRLLYHDQEEENDLQEASF